MIGMIPKSDVSGAVASAFCMIHCLVTPFLFIANTQVVGVHGEAPLWWRSIDFVFLVISFLAVYRSAQASTKSWMKPALWLSWVALFILIVNEKFALVHLAEFMIYIPALLLIVLHLYNRRHCQHKSDKSV